MPIGSSAPGLTILGDICIDFVMGPIEHWPTVGTETIVESNEMRAGGSAGNAALTMRHLGVGAKLISQVGNDKLGEWLVGQFNGIDSVIESIDAPTSISTGVVHSCSERTLFTTRGHLEQISWVEFEKHIGPAQVGDIALLTGAFLLPKLRSEYRKVIEALCELGYQIAIDTGWPAQGWEQDIRQEVFGWLQNCDHVLLNEAEVRGLGEDQDLESAFSLLRDRMKSDATLVAKLGAKGAIGQIGAEACAVTTPEISPFDTIGAGDAFNAGYLASRLAGLDLRNSLAGGCRTASDVISRFPRSGISPGEIGRNASLEAAG